MQILSSLILLFFSIQFVVAEENDYQKGGRSNSYAQSINKILKA